MKTSLNDIKKAEDYLNNRMDAGESLLFQATMMVNPSLQRNVYCQQKVYALLRMYHRRKLKAEVESVHQRIFSDPERSGFRRSILKFFNH